MTFLDLIKIKSEVLCWGIKTNNTAEQIYQIQHPTAHKRTGNVGLHLLLDDKLVINAIYGEKFSETSPYHLEKTKNGFILCKNSDDICQFKTIQPPAWYFKKTKDGTLMSNIFLQEGKETLITAIWNNCCYFSNNTQCRFCVLGYEKGVEMKKVDQIAETVRVALQENPNHYVHLTGGNTFSSDHGIAYYEKYVKAIRAVNKSVPISLEVAPPNDCLWLKKLADAGANGFSINIEVWDEKKRKVICPGKSKIKRKLYFAAWKKGVELLGKYKISSMLIVGLDSKESIKDGVKSLIKIGVKPTLIPFRPFSKGQLLYLSPPNPEEFMELSEFAGREMAKNNADYNLFVGCEHCGACTMENDYLRIIKKSS